MNTLSQRLKYAKRELTALKTAHPRGLGNLRVYRKDQTITTPASSGGYRATITGSFSSLFTPFPFVQARVGATSSPVLVLAVDGFEYNTGGMGFTVTMSAYFPTASTQIDYSILSMAPVEITSVEWEAVDE